MNIELQIFYQLLLSAILGGIIGIEREYGRKEAGLRTYALVALSSCLFAAISLYGLERVPYSSFVKADPMRVVQAIALGVGFIGGGLIIFRKGHVEGLTTAAGIWSASAIGLTVGFGFYVLAIFATFLVLAILSILRLFEERVMRQK